ncbi:MAG TPA: SDR family oxidoreductase, partial [Ktedonobacteraceae bacterium]|nr:SDR family oxidoreductase [Ktedonobacteraceae bacterium]
KPLLEATCDDWDELLNINLRGYFLCSKAVASAMIARGQGSIIHISSNHAFATLPHAEMYAASKGGINAMTRAMALSLGTYGIRVNAICPGFTATEHFASWAQDKGETRTRVEDMHALKRINQPEDIGQLALYLASPASRTMTGAALLIDAGLTASLYHEAQD